MTKPSSEAFETALAEAERMREAKKDPQHLGEVLLYLHRRLGHLERIEQAAERYMHFGQEEREHAELVLVLEQARHAEAHERGVDEEDLGLG